MDELPPAEDELAAALRDGHLEENPDNKEEVRITNAGLARYLILQPSAELVLASSDDEPPDEPVPPIEEPESEPAPPPSEPPELLEP